MIAVIRGRENKVRATGHNIRKQRRQENEQFMFLNTGSVHRLVCTFMLLCISVFNDEIHACSLH